MSIRASIGMQLRSYLGLLVERLPEDPLAWRDADFIRSELKVLGPITDTWFAPEVIGLEQLPEGPALMVGTHNGGVLVPDMFSFMVAFWRRFGAERVSYGLAHDRLFDVPGIGPWLAKVGAVPAHPRHAVAALKRGASVLVYPGGDLDTFKPYRERHVVKFGGRTGFIRIALQTGAPIVPMVSVGAHETICVLTDGRSLAERLGLKRLLRVEVLPIMLCLPWGVWVGAFEAHVPLPSKLRIQLLPPIHFGLPPEAADDDALVESLAERVRATMQAALDALAAAGGYGVLERLRMLPRELLLPPAPARKR